jgi:hypothetical protein
MALIVSLRNISGLTEVSDYHYEVFLNTTCIESGFVRGHNRSDGWDGLILLLGSEREVKERYDVRPPVASKPPKQDVPFVPILRASKPTKSKKATR